jgi:hypothetical protein
MFNMLCSCSHVFPPSVCLSNNLSAMKHTDFVDSAIQNLLDRGLIVTCEVQPTVVNPLTVSIHSNNIRTPSFNQENPKYSVWG